MPEPIITSSAALKVGGAVLAIGIAWGSLQYQVNNQAKKLEKVSGLPTDVAVIDERQKNFKEDISEIKSILRTINGKIDDIKEEVRDQQ